MIFLVVMEIVCSDGVTARGENADRLVAVAMMLLLKVDVVTMSLLTVQGAYRY